MSIANDGCDLLSRSCDPSSQVRELAANLHRILLDTVKMQEAHEVCGLSVKYSTVRCVVIGSSCVNGSYVQNIKGVSTVYTDMAASSFQVFCTNILNFCCASL